MAIRDSGLPPREPQKPHLVPRPQLRRHRRWLLWLTIVIVVVLVAGGLLVYTALHGGPLHQYAISRVEQELSSSLNGPVHIDNLRVYPSLGIVDLYGATVRGSNPNGANAAASAANLPLLQVEHLHLGVRVSELLHGKVDLNNIVIDHPIVHLIINQNGQTNLPDLTSSSNSNTSVFDLGVRHAAINNGEIYVNDRKNTLNADLHDVDVQADHVAGTSGKYTGTLSYNDGHLDYDSYAPVPHALQAKFEVGASGLAINDAKLTSGRSQVMLNASIENYSKPAIHAKYVVILDMGEVRQVMKDTSLPTGIVLVNGTADYNSVPGRAPLETAAVQGTISSHVLQLRSASLNSDIRELSAHYNLAGGNAELRDVTARLLGGELTAQATVRNLAGNQQGHVVADLHNVSAGDLKRVAAAASLKPVAISGHVSGRMVADWTGSIKNLLLRADANANANVRPVNSSASAAVPVNAVVHARYDARSQQLGLQQSYVRMPATTLNLNGTISRHSALQVQLHSSDLHQLESVAEVFAEVFAKPSSPLPPISGAASFDGSVRGSTAAPQIAGKLTASNLQVRDAKIASLSTQVQASPSNISLQNGRLQLAQKQGRVSFDVQSGLDNWAHKPSSTFNVNLKAGQISLAELAQIANLQTPLSGTLNANVAAHGTQLQPIGQGEIDLKNANIAGEPLQVAQLRFQGTGQAVQSNLLVKVSGGSANGQFTYYPRQEGYEGYLRATNIQLGKLQILQQHNLPMTGTLNLTANGRGTLSNPEGTASLTIPQLEMRGQKIEGINLQAKVANHEASFNLGSSISKVPLSAKGNIALTGAYVADVSLNTPVIPLKPLLELYAPTVAANVSGQTAIHATLRGPVKDPTRLQGQVAIPTLEVAYSTKAAPGASPTVLRVAAVGPIQASYLNGVVSLQPGEIKGTDTDVRFAGDLPLKNSSAPATITVQGGVNLTILQAFDPTVSSGGRMVFDINARGYHSQNVEGQIRFVNASFSTPSAPIGLAKANGVLTLRPDRVDITQFTGDVGGGTITASGGLIYRPSLHYNIALKGAGLRVLYPDTVRTDFGLNLAMTGDTSGGLLAGQVNINSVSFTPDFDLTQFMTQFGGVASPPPSQSFADGLQLSIAVRSSSELHVISPTVSIQGDANLRVVGTAANPVIVGRTNLSGGDVIALGNRYTIEGGTIAFVNSVQTEPVVNLQVNTTIQQYKITASFRGPLDRLRTDYTSDPALAQADIIHLIAFGNTEEAANAAPAQSTTLGAESLVASQVTSQVTSRLQKALGVSQISVDPQLASTAGAQQQGARITVRQRVTSKMFVTFSTDVTTTQYSAVQLQYQMNRKWSVSGVRDQNGGFGLDGRYHKDF